MADIKDLEKLKNRVAKLKEESDRAAGALESYMNSLETEYGVKSIAQAEKLLKKFEQEEIELKHSFDILYDEFIDRWGTIFDKD